MCVQAFHSNNNRVWFNFSQAASSGYEKKIGDQLRQDPTLLVSDVIGTLEKIVHHKCAYIGVYCTYILNLLNTLLTENISKILKDVSNDWFYYAWGHES